MSQLDEAFAFAAIAHAGQRRKYDGLPYVTHPIAVMLLLWDGGIRDEDILIAALLHDVVEDTAVSLTTIERRFGARVADIVKDLTDVYTKEAYPKENRETRKRMERDRVSNTSFEAQTVKYADLIHNTRSIVPNDKNFAVVYLKEKAAMLEVMTDGDPLMRGACKVALQLAQNELLQDALR